MTPDEIVKLVLAVIGAISLITTALPNTNNNKAVQFVLNVLNALGMNFGKNTNAK